jgi:tRNA-binding protein
VIFLKSECGRLNAEVFNFSFRNQPSAIRIVSNSAFPPYLCTMETISWQDFEKVELHAGTILAAVDFPEARKPSYKVKVDFGSFGIKWSSAQITKHYKKEQLVGRQIIGVINFPKKQIATFMSEFLVTGFADENGDIVLASIEQKVPNGSKLI